MYIYINTHTHTSTISLEYRNIIRKKAGERNRQNAYTKRNWTGSPVRRLVYDKFWSLPDAFHTMNKKRVNNLSSVLPRVYFVIHDWYTAVIRSTRQLFYREEVKNRKRVRKKEGSDFFSINVLSFGDATTRRSHTFHLEKICTSVGIKDT